jgi:dTDP-4-dehydrorhamnose reductase
MIHILGSGFVAQAFARYCIINSIPHKVISRSEIPYTNPINLAAFLTASKPDVLVNCAGYVGDCERHKTTALYSNAILPGFIGEICQSLNLPWIHVSSGDIYDYPWCSNPHLSYTEEDIANFKFAEGKPGNFYCGTKALGEELIAQFKTAYVCRISAPFTNTSNARNYLSILASSGVVPDVTRSISSLEEFVKASLVLWSSKAPFGTYNVVNPTPISNRDIIAKLREAGIRKEEPVYLTRSLFDSYTKTQFSSCVMSCEKLSRHYNMTPTEVAVDAAVKSWVA